MSQVLDEVILKDVAKTCPDSFLNYNKCVQSKNPNLEECLKYQFELQKCVQTQVPTFQKIQTKCASIIKEYESCLLVNQREAGSKCAEQLQNLRTCAFDAIK